MESLARCSMQTRRSICSTRGVAHTTIPPRRPALVAGARDQRSRHNAKHSQCLALGDGEGSTPVDVQDDFADALKADLERLQRRQQQQQGNLTSAGPSSRSGSEASGSGGANPVKEAVDKLLVANFFVVVAILGWLGAGLAEEGILGSSALVDAWLPLWPVVFQPAIGVLMAGALASGGLGWLEQQRRGGGGSA